MWYGGEHARTIDLECATHGAEHGSNHRTIETIFDISVPVPTQQERLLLENAPWKEINAGITQTLDSAPSEGTVQRETDMVVAAMIKAVHALTPKARPSPYAKRWWATGPTQLRCIYTYWIEVIQRCPDTITAPAQLATLPRRPITTYRDYELATSQAHIS